MRVQTIPSLGSDLGALRALTFNDSPNFPKIPHAAAARRRESNPEHINLHAVLAPSTAARHNIP